MSKSIAKMAGLPLVLFMLALAGCGGSDSKDHITDPDPTVTGSMTATVDGQPWIGATSTLRARAVPAIAGGYEIAGVHNPGLDGRQIVINLYNIDTPGTYPLGVNPTIFGGYALYTRTGGATWQSPYSGSAGEVVVTELTATRIIGTFHFFATPLAGTLASGTHTITAGEFDLPLEGTAAPIPEDVGSHFSASLNGSFYSAAYAALADIGGHRVATIQNNSYNITFFLDGIADPGVYPLSMDAPVRIAEVNAGADAPAGTNCCWGISSEDVGTVTVTSLTSARMTGSFSMTLVPRPDTPATSPLVITNGSFSLGAGSP